MPITVHETASFDMEGCPVLVAFPSFGLVGTLAANFLVEHLAMKEVGSLDCADFPTLAVVEDGEPLSPVRIYSGPLPGKKGSKNLVLVLSEFQPDPPLVHELAAVLIGWCEERRAGLIVSPEGLLVDSVSAGTGGLATDVFAAASNEDLREQLRKLETPLFRNGLVTGATGALLVAGKREGVPVVGILAEAKPEHPDARSSAKVVDLLGQLLNVPLDSSVLVAEAERFEAKVAEAMRVQRSRDRERGHAQSVMYG